MPNVNLTMSDWMWRIFGPMLPQSTGKVPFVPEFETIENVSISAGTTVLSNSSMYVTLATAQAMMAKFGANHIEEVIDPNTPDGFHVTIKGDAADVGKVAMQRWLAFAAGTPLKNNNGVVFAVSPIAFKLPAGMLASSYLREPESDSPEVMSSQGWPPQPVLLLSNAEQDAWAVLRAQAGVKLV